MKKIQLFLTAFILITGIWGCVCAKESYSVSYLDDVTTKISFEGNTGVNRANQQVFIRVIAKDYAEDGTLPSFTTDDIVTMGTAKTNENGTYLWDCTIENAEGGYYFIANCETLQKPVYKYIEVYSKQKVDEAFEDLNKKADLSSDFERIFKHLSIDVSDSSDLDRTVIYNCLISARSYSTAEQVKQVYDKAVKIAVIQQNNNKINDLLNCYSEFGITDEEITLFGTLSAEVKALTMSKLSETTINDVNDFKTAFQNAMFLSQLDLIGNISEIKQIIIDNNFYIGLNLTQFNLLSSDKKNAVLNSVSKNITDIENFKTVFSSSVKENSENNISDGNTSVNSNKVSYSTDVKSQTVTPIENVSETESVQLNFVDVSKDFWAYKDILSLYEKGIINGVTEDEFSPDSFITREQFAKILTVAFQTENKGNTLPFSDVKKGDWYYPYVQTLYSNGFIKGIGENTFGTGNNITRSDAAVMIYNLLKSRTKALDDEITVYPFEDEALIADYAREAVLVLRENNLISGVGNNRFEPFSFITRAQAAKMVNNILSFESKQ